MIVAEIFLQARRSPFSAAAPSRIDIFTIGLHLEDVPLSIFRRFVALVRIFRGRLLCDCFRGIGLCLLIRIRPARFVFQGQFICSSGQVCPAQPQLVGDRFHGSRCAPAGMSPSGGSLPGSSGLIPPAATASLAFFAS